MNKASSIKKSFEILEAFLQISTDEIRLSDIAKLTGLTTATANRIASTLVELGYLSQSEKRGKYSLGPKFSYFDRVRKSKDTVEEVAKPHLSKLSKLTRETVCLSKFDGRKIFTVEVILSQQPLSFHTDSTTGIPLYASGIGKIFLANMTENELERYCKNTKFVSYTANTITEPYLLRSQLITVAKEAIAYSDEELYEGVRDVAAGIKDFTGKLMYSLNVLAPTVRLTRAKMPELARVVRQYAMDISKAIGYRGD